MSLSVVRHSGIVWGAASPLTYSFPTLPPAGRAFLVLIVGSNGYPVTVTHNQAGAQFTRLSGANLDNGRWYVDAFLLDAIAAPTGTYTVSLATAGGQDETGFVVLELDGNGASVLEQVAEALYTPNWGSSPGTHSITVASNYSTADNLVFSFATGRATGPMTITPPAGSTLLASRPGVGFANSPSAFAYQQVSSVNKVTHTWNFGNANGIGDGVIAMVALKAGVFTAPTLTGFANPSRTDTTANLTVTSDTAGATIYFAATAAATYPGDAEMAAGTGGGILVASSLVGAVGANAGTMTGLSASTAYYFHVVQKNGGAYSNHSTIGPFSTTATAPAITGSTPMSALVGGNIVLTGTNFGATTGPATIGGVAVTPSAWSNTGATLPVPLTALKYGVPVDVVVTNATTGLASAAFQLTMLLPATGNGYVTFGTLNPDTSQRVEADIPLVPTDQAEWTNAAKVTIGPDGSPYSNDSTVTSFDVRFWSSTGGGWSAWVTQTINAPAAPSGKIAGILATL